MTVAKISKLAGVSPATVSRVINGNAQVDPQLAKTVREVMKRVGYVPQAEQSVGRPRHNPLGLRTRRVAVLIPDTDPQALRTALSGRLLLGIEAVLRKRDLSLMVTGLAAPDRLPACIERREVDGVIVRGGLPASLAPLLAKIPYVGMLESGPSDGWRVDSAVEDNSTIGTTAAEYLVRQGRRHLAFVTNLPAHASFRVRAMFFQQRARELGVTVDMRLAEQPVGETVEQLLKGPDWPAGLFVPGRDEEVMKVYRALRERDLQPGRDLDLICCFNDAHHLPALDPHIVNIDIQAEEIGRAAVELLLWRLQHPKDSPRRVVIAPLVGKSAAHRHRAVELLAVGS